MNTRDNIDMGANTDGQIWLAEARLVDPVTGAPVAAGEEGEIVANAPQMLLGYARVEDNDDAFDEEGYFHMGDLGKLVGEDYITVTGRKKDLIIRAGENLSPKEVEDILYNHPNIADISIVAMPDKRTGEKAAAFVVPAEGKTVTLESIAAYLIDYGTAKQKIPEWLEIVDDFPRTSVGKVRKDLLRKRARDIYEAQSEQKP